MGARYDAVDKRYDSLKSELDDLNNSIEKLQEDPVRHKTAIEILETARGKAATRLQLFIHKHDIRG